MKYFLLAWLWLASLGAWAQPMGHSHNDYLQDEPFWGAARAGMVSLEADIYPDAQGRLLVGHCRAQLEGDRDLATLYLKPLQDWQGAPLELLIDIKADADKTMLFLAPLLLEFASDKLAVVIISGARPRAWPPVPMPAMLSIVTIEGTVEEMRSGRLPQGCRYVSAKWSSLFSWKGEGEMPAEQLEKLTRVVQEAHSKGLKLRLWGAPDGSASWQAQFRAGVDRINTDDPAGLSDWLEEQEGEETGS